MSVLSRMNGWKRVVFAGLLAMLLSLNALAALTPLAAGDFADLTAFLEGSVPAVVAVGAVALSVLAVVGILKWLRALL